MPIYLNGIKYNGIILNGQKMNSILNGNKLFQYNQPKQTKTIAAIFKLFGRWYGYTQKPIQLQIPLKSSYSLNDLKALGLDISNIHWKGQNFGKFITPSIKQTEYPVTKAELIRYDDKVSDYEISVKLR